MTSPPPILFHQWSQEGSAEADVAAHHRTWKTTSVISIGCHILHFLFSIVTEGSVSIEGGMHFSGKVAAVYPITIVCNPLSNTCYAYSCSATEKDRLDPIIYLFVFLLYFCQLRVIRLHTENN